MDNKLIYLMRVGACWYVKGIGLWRGYCYICGKKRKTTAHHLIPKRLHNLCKNDDLKELRISVCEDCDKKLHPENKIFKEDEALIILSKQSNKYSKKANERALRLNILRGKFISLKAQITNITDEIDNILYQKKDGENEKQI